MPMGGSILIIWSIQSFKNAALFTLFVFCKVFLEYVTVWRLQICVIIFKFLLYYESSVLIKFLCTMITAKYMQVNFWDVTPRAILDGAVQQLWTNLVASIRFQHSDCHDIDDLVSRGLRFLLWAILHLRHLVLIPARYSSDQHVLVISEYRIPSIVG